MGLDVSGDWIPKVDGVDSMGWERKRGHSGQCMICNISPLWFFFFFSKSIYHFRVECCFSFKIALTSDDELIDC